MGGNLVLCRVSGGHLIVCLLSKDLDLVLIVLVPNNWPWTRELDRAFVTLQSVHCGGIQMTNQNT